MLHLCAEHLDKEKDQSHQSFATIGVALIAMGEDVGSEMSLRMFNHLVRHSYHLVEHPMNGMWL
jgi:26S proteasome regulatory subunit N1